MKKKNVVGPMVAAKGATGGWLRKLKLMPRLLCLLAAVVIWLLVVNMVDSKGTDIPSEPNLPVTEYAEE